MLALYYGAGAFTGLILPNYVSIRKMIMRGKLSALIIVPNSIGFINCINDSKFNIDIISLKFVVVVII